MYVPLEQTIRITASGSPKADVSATLIRLEAVLFWEEQGISSAKNNADATTGRGDCTALCEIDESDYAGKNQATAIPDIITGLGFEKLSKYAAHFGPYVVYQIDKGKNPWNKFYDSK